MSLTDETGPTKKDCKNELKTAADIKFLEWWFCRSSKKAKKIYEDYLVLVREHNAIGN